MGPFMENNMATYSFLSDPGHGWLKVPFSDLLAVGLDLSKISTFSYYDEWRDNVYLEEDCDLSIFVGAYKKVHGHEPKIRVMRQSERQSKVRSYYRNPYGETNRKILFKTRDQYFQG